MKNLFVCLLFVFIFSSIETELIFEMNKVRAENNVAELNLNREAARLARYRAEEMVELNFFGHNSRIYGEPDEMLVRFGVRFNEAGVNIAKGQDSADEVVRAWMTSASHAENILNENFTSVGVGVSFCDGLPYWTAFFISSM
jgi:uncharacterized protein YkwD